MTTIEPQMEIVVESLKNNFPLQEYYTPAELMRDMQLGEYPQWLSFPVCFRQYEKRGKQFRDVLGDGMRLILISDRMRDILLQEKLTGWKTYPILFYDYQGEEVFGYNGFSIVGRGGNISCPVDNAIKTIHLSKQEKLYDVRQWDGTDFFTINMSPFVTERAMKVMKKTKITSLIFDPIEDYYTLIGME